MSSTPHIVAIIPAFQEATRIAHVVTDAMQYVSQVIVVDDGSSDDTSTVAAKAGATVIRHLENSGAGAATMTGIEAARAVGATIVVTLDADGQHDPADIPLMLEPVLKHLADIVFGNRFGRRNHIPFVRRFFNAIGNVLTLLVTSRWVADSQCGFKVLGPRALEEIDLRMNGFEFCTEMVRETVIHRWRLAQIPTKVTYSEYTMAKGQSFASGVRTALKILLRSFLR
jgi:glycosyltransferase involved in cell wall biosynthesis